MVYQIKNSLLKKCPNTDVHNGLKSLQTVLPNNTHFQNNHSTYHVSHSALIQHIRGIVNFLKKREKKIKKDITTISKYKDYITSGENSKTVKGRVRVISF